MSWPPTPNAAFLIEGVSSIRFGTDGVLAVVSPNGTSGGYGGSYTVESIRGADEIDPAYIGQGHGLKSTRVLLNQGRRYQMTFVDDTGFVPPSPGSLIQLVDTMNGGAFSLQFVVVENGNLAARKTEHKREVTVEYLTAIEGGSNPPSQGGSGDAGGITRGFGGEGPADM